MIFCIFANTFPAERQMSIVKFINRRQNRRWRQGIVWLLNFKNDEKEQLKETTNRN